MHIRTHQYGPRMTRVRESRRVDCSGLVDFISGPNRSEVMKHRWDRFSSACIAGDPADMPRTRAMSAAMAPIALPVITLQFLTKRVMPELLSQDGSSQTKRRDIFVCYAFTHSAASHVCAT
jgi:hypothetical protein